MRSQAAHQLPEVICRRASTAPVIDGLLDDEAWNRAEMIEPFWQLRHDAALPLTQPNFPTKVRCLWDDAYLYVAFECECPDVWATRTQRDSDLWNEPVVEVFLDVLGDGKSFFEFQVNPLGTVYDSFVPDVGLKDEWQRWSKWNSESLKTGISVDGKLNDRSYRDNGWSAEFAISFEDLAAETAIRPTVGGSWRVNFCRYDYSSELSKPELSCWSPVVKTYDDLARFGRLVFAD